MTDGGLLGRAELEWAFAALGDRLARRWCRHETKVAELLAELDTNLAGVRHPFTSASSADRIYEVYALSLVIAAAVKAGAQLRYYAGSRSFAKEVKDL
jgi:hypothetical protein